MASVTETTDGLHLVTVDQHQPLLLSTNSLTTVSSGNNGQIQIINLILPNDQVSFSQNSYSHSVFTVGQLCQPVTIPSSQMQSTVIFPQLEMNVKHHTTNTSGKHRKTKKRRRMNKELEMLGRSVVIKERQQQFMNETQWMPITQGFSSQGLGRLASPVPEVDDTSLYIDVITAETNNTTPIPMVAEHCSSHISSPSCVSTPQHRAVLAPTPVRSRPNPLPVFPWADSREIWETMMSKEELPGYKRDYRWFSRHPALQPRLRTVLLDWLMEVCEEYRLRRETYHVAIDFIDRFLSRTSSISRRQLQLIGISALFVAAKVEEIHPVKVADISYVTGDTCTDKEILQQERAILKELKWDLTPITCVSWVTVFLQTLCAGGAAKRDNLQFMTPQYSQHAFVQIMRLLDLCLLDAGSLQFPYSVLAASAVHHMSSMEDALSVSGYQWTDIAPCVQWMSVFADVLRDAGATPVKFFDRISSMETHTLQTHVVNSTTLASVHRRKTDVPLNSNNFAGVSPTNALSSVFSIS